MWTPPVRPSATKRNGRLVSDRPALPHRVRPSPAANPHVRALDSRWSYRHSGGDSDDGLTRRHACTILPPRACGGEQVGDASETDRGLEINPVEDGFTI